MVVDTTSKWAEVEIDNYALTSSSTIHQLEKMFTQHGYPSIMVSNNASIFHSEEFSEYCIKNGIHQKFIAPNYPATNGLAERNVQTLKRRLTAMQEDPVPLKNKLQTILRYYCVTPLTSGKSLAELYLQRKLRFSLDAIFPRYKSSTSSLDKIRTRTLSEGQRVIVCIFQNNRFIRSLGEIKQKVGIYHYQVTLDSGRIIKRHINQLRSILVPKQNHVHFQHIIPAPIPTPEVIDQ